MNRGRLLVFEGVDGCGKTTQARTLADWLRARSHRVLITKEPTGGRYGELIRGCSARGEAVSAEQELEWFVADRCEHVRDVIEPALAAGDHVICDRYFLSTIAYQGARGIPFEQILADSEAKFPHPDLAFWLDIDPRQGLARVDARGEPLDPIFEEQGRLERAALIFAAIDRDYVHRIDATAAIPAMTAAILAVIREALPELAT